LGSRSSRHMRGVSAHNVALDQTRFARSCTKRSRSKRDVAAQFLRSRDLKKDNAQIAIFTLSTKANPYSSL
jgi:hypothetical protein